jgi:hypothetical protein
MLKFNTGMRILALPEMHILLVYNSTQVEHDFVREDKV